MPFETMLYLALAVSAAGLLHKLSRWFSCGRGGAYRKIKPATRVYAALRGILAALFSGSIFKIIEAVLFEVLFQSRLFKLSFLRWLSHMLIFWGVLPLILTHALARLIVEPLFGPYYFTQNPFFFLRSLFASTVFIGLSITLYRRLVRKVPKPETRARDLYAIFIIAAIMISGIFLEGLKISSRTEFEQMVEVYAGGIDPSEKEALESLWVQSYGLSSADVKRPFKPEVIEKGWESHQLNCAGCHASAKWAFIGYTVAETARPIAVYLDEAGGVEILWYIHIIACFAGLAYVPFGKMFHILAAPLTLMANAAMGEESADANVLTRQEVELDACTNCATCSLHCSAVAAFKVTGNKYILPSEKMLYLQQESSRRLSPEKITAIQAGFCLCTNCGRCTELCPSGIRLKDLWFNRQEDLLQNGYPGLCAFSALSFNRGVKSNKIPQDQYDKPLLAARKLIADTFATDELKRTPIRLKYMNREFKTALLHSFRGETVSLCYSCSSCSTICPVVNSYDNPTKALDLLPHQVIRAAVLGLGELAFNSNMLWYCLGCYQCQENCPQNVQIAEIFCELRNLAIERMNLRLNRQGS